MFLSLVFELTCAACIGPCLYQSILRQLFQNGFPTLTKGQGDGVTAHQGGFRALACALGVTQGNGLASTPVLVRLRLRLVSGLGVFCSRYSSSPCMAAIPIRQKEGRRLLKTAGNIHLVRTNDGGRWLIYCSILMLSESVIRQSWRRLQNDINNAHQLSETKSQDENSGSSRGKPNAK